MYWFYLSRTRWFDWSLELDLSGVVSDFGGPFSVVSVLRGSRMNRGIATVGITRAGFTAVTVGRRGLSVGLAACLETWGWVLVGGCVLVTVLGLMVVCRAWCVLRIRLRTIEMVGAAAMAKTTMRTAVTRGETPLR